MQCMLLMHIYEIIAFVCVAYSNLIYFLLHRLSNKQGNTAWPYTGN